MYFCLTQKLVYQVAIKFWFRKALTNTNSYRSIPYVYVIVGHKEMKLPLHYENLPMQFTDIFSAVNIKNSFEKKNGIFNILAQNIDCGNTFGREAVLTSIHNLSFCVKIRKVSIPLHTPVLLCNSGVQDGIHFMDMFSSCSMIASYLADFGTRWPHEHEILNSVRF